MAFMIATLPGLHLNHTLICIPVFENYLHTSASLCIRRLTKNRLPTRSHVESPSLWHQTSSPTWQTRSWRKNFAYTSQKLYKLLKYRPRCGAKLPLLAERTFPRIRVEYRAPSAVVHIRVRCIFIACSDG